MPGFRALTSLMWLLLAAAPAQAGPSDPPVGAMQAMPGMAGEQTAGPAAPQAAMPRHPGIAMSPSETMDGPTGASEAGSAPQSSPFNPLSSSAPLPAEPSARVIHKYSVEQIKRLAARNTRLLANHAVGERVPVTGFFTGPTVEVHESQNEYEERAWGRTEINEDTLFDTIVTQSGLVKRLFVFPGETVAVGQPLISIFSPERINAQHMFLADFSRDPGNQTRLEYYSSFESVGAYLGQSKSNLRWWGFTDTQIRQLLKTGKVQEDYVVSSARDGYVIDTVKQAGSIVVAGGRDEENFVLPGDTLLHEASLLSVWGMMFVRPSDYDDFRLGQVVTVTIGEGPNRSTTTGAVVHKHEYADEETRDPDFHLLLFNSDGSVPPGTFVSVSMKKRESGIWIPASGILQERSGPCVIEADGDRFYLRRIAVRRYVGDKALVSGGLDDGVHIVANPRAEIDPDRQSAWLRAWN